MLPKPPGVDCIVISLISVGKFSLPSCHTILFLYHFQDLVVDGVNFLITGLGQVTCFGRGNVKVNGVNQGLNIFAQNGFFSVVPCSTLK